MPRLHCSGQVTVHPEPEVKILPTSVLPTTQPERRDRYRPVTISTMNPRVIVGIAAVVGAAASGVFGMVANIEMVEEVNSRLPKESQFSPTGWYLSKTLRLHREYKRLFPKGTLLPKVRIAIVIAFGCLVGGMWALGFFQ